ncbi:PG0541 family transporter-associated protein [Salinispira pacifica]
MVRLELIGNRAVEDDLYDLFRKQDLNPYYTKLAEVQGFGDSGTRKGDHIFPEENFVLIFYCDEEIADRIGEVVRELKLIFPSEGIVLYRTAAERVV